MHKLGTGPDMKKTCLELRAWSSVDDTDRESATHVHESCVKKHGKACTKPKEILVNRCKIGKNFVKFHSFNHGLFTESSVSNHAKTSSIFVDSLTNDVEIN